jgi:hypothetical protein
MKARKTNSIHLKQAGGRVRIMEVNSTAENIAGPGF